MSHSFNIAFLFLSNIAFAFAFLCIFSLPLHFLPFLHFFFSETHDELFVLSFSSVFTKFLGGSSDMLSIHPSDSGIKYFSPQSLQNVFSQAKLLLKKDNIAQMGSECVVVKDSGFYEVTVRNGFFMCSGRRCMQFHQEFGGLFCAHTLAAAEWKQCLPIALVEIEKQQANITSQLLIQQSRNPASGIIFLIYNCLHYFIEMQSSHE